MSAFSDMSLSGTLNGVLTSTNADTPIDRAMNPVGYVQPGVAKWVDRQSGISVGFPNFTMSIRQPTKESRLYKVQAKLMIPTLEQTSPSTATGIQPAPTKAYDCSAVLEFMLPERSTTAERLVLLNNCMSLFGLTINASDGSPTGSVGSPLRLAILNFDYPY